MIRNGGLGSFEWPKDASGWKRPEIRKMPEKLGVQWTLMGVQLGLFLRKKVNQWLNLGKSQQQHQVSFSQGIREAEMPERS